MKRSDRRLIRAAYKAVGQADDSIECMLDDPMTRAMGAPTDELSELFYRKELNKLISFPEGRIREFPKLQSMVFDRVEFLHEVLAHNRW